MNDDLGSAAVPAGTIVVGLDAHDTWQDAVDWAADQAARERRAVTLVHVADPATELWHDTSGRDTRIGVMDSPTLPVLLLDEARTRVARRAPDVTVHVVLMSGGVRDALCSTALDAHLLVVGARRHRTVWSHLFGTVGSAVTRRPPCPAVVVHATNPGKVHRGVLVGIDDTEHSQAALRFAFRQASLRQLPLTVVHVALEPTYGDPVDDPEDRLHLAEALAGLREVFPDVHVQTSIRYGEPAGMMLAASRLMDLVVLGAHHGRAITEVLRGAVVAPVVERATCPVAMVPEDPVATSSRRTS